MDENQTQPAAPRPIPQPPTDPMQQQYHTAPRYDGWLVSNSLVKRSLAVLGHYTVGSIILMVPFIVLGVILNLSRATSL